MHIHSVYCVCVSTFGVLFNLFSSSPRAFEAGYTILRCALQQTFSSHVKKEEERKHKNPKTEPEADKREERRKEE